MAISAAIVVVFIAAAWGTLAILFPPQRVRALVQTQLSRTLNREVRFGGAELGLFPPVRLTIPRLAISEAGGFASGTMVQTGSIHLDLDVLPLLSRRIVVRRLVLDEPGLHVVLKPDGTTNLTGLFKTSAPGGPAARPMDFSVNELSVRHGRLLVDDLTAARRRTLTLDTRIALQSRQGTRTTTSGHTVLSGYAFGPLSVTSLTDLDNALAPIELVVDHRGVFDAKMKRLALDRLDLQLGDAKLGIFGTVNDPGVATVVDLRARGSGIDMGELLGALAKAEVAALHDVRGDGKVDFDLAIRGSLAAGRQPAVIGTLRVTDGSFRYPQAPAGVEDLTFTARFAPDSLGIGDLAARVAGQPVRGALAMTRFRDPLVRFTLQGNVDLAAVAPMIAPKDTRLGGRVALNVTGRGRAKDTASMALDGAARFANVSVQTPQVPSKIEGVNGEVRFSQARAQVTGLTGKAGRSAFVLNAQVGRPLALLSKLGSTPPSQVSFDLRSTYMDLADFMPAGSGPLIIPNATGGGRVSIARLKNEKLDVERLDAQVVLDPGVVSADPFSMAAYQGLISGKARIDARDPAKPGLSLDARVDSLAADAILSTWTGARDLLRGRLNTGFKFAVEGATPDEMKRTLTALGMAEMLRGQIGPGPVLAEIAKVVRIPALSKLHFDKARVPFNVQRGRVVTGPVEFSGGTGRWNVLGSVGFDGSLDYAVSLTLPPEMVQALNARSALAAGALTDNNGNLLVDLRVSGTYKNPRVTMDVAAMRDRVQGKISQALEQQREKIEGELKAAAEARQQAAVDSARRATERVREAVKDSLRRKARGVLEGFFGGAATDTTKP